MPVHRSLDYYTQMQRELEVEKLCNDDADHVLNSHFSRQSDTQSRQSDALSRSVVSDGEGVSQAHKFRVHKLNKVASPIPNTTKD
jgi:hypothetical protein